ncbi:ribonucleoside-triphosphate reductase, adenosylcobalamin-dependent [Nocardia grenadensis]|uniref:ribonucleoside-triphosphate reductase, adenosylcobalamin-dependent n=1 Tax=Nocardia grenadensis TaxID=931537 RepID=UPI003D7523C4
MEFTDTGRLVYERTYARTKPDGAKEDWPETVRRVVDGNLALVPERYQQPGEREDLIRMIENFEIIPAGRHLWTSGVPGAQFPFNCWVSGWDGKPSDHYNFTFLRLMEGGGVGASYSNSYLAGFPPVLQTLAVQIVCDPTHPDYQAMKDAGVLSDIYDADWAGAFEVEDSREGWAAALVDLIDTFYRDDVQHIYRVYDISRVRPSGARLKTFGGTASGPAPLARMLTEVGRILSGLVGGQLDGLSAMEIDHALAECVVSGGVRRSARMAMMHWADPQIEEFIRCKQLTGKHWTTNISVEVDDYFWESVSEDPDYDGSERANAIDARAVLKAISEGMVHNGEPGIWDSTLSNVGEPNRVVCTNPCGEITLESSEPCNLGHVNLAAFVDEYGQADEDGIERAHELATRFLMRATFANVNDPKSREVLDRNRRIGVGHLGVASFLALIGIPFSKTPSTMFPHYLDSWAGVVDEAAEKFAHELRIPVPVKKRTVAPTGTIAKMPGVSEGIHPIFSRYFIRRIRFSTVDPSQVAQLEEMKRQGYHVEPCQYAENTAVVSIPTKDSLVEAVERIYGPERAEEIVESADELRLFQHLNMQACYQFWWADNSVSYTANVDPETYTPEDVAQTIRDFGGRLKGATIFPAASMPQSPYERITREEYEAATAVAVADGVDEQCSSGGCPIR